MAELAAALAGKNLSALASRGVPSASMHPVNQSLRLHCEVGMALNKQLGAMSDCLARRSDDARVNAIPDK